MPGGITLKTADPADIPTPDTDKATIFIDSTNSDTPSYKDDTGAVSPLGTTGAAGATGPAGPTGPQAIGFVLYDTVSAEEPMMMPGGGGGSASVGGQTIWDHVLVVATDFDVVNDITLTTIPDLQFAVNTGEVWVIEVYLAYAGNSTSMDIRVNATFPNVTGGILQTLFTTAGDTISATQQRVTSATSFTNIVGGTRSTLASFELMQLRMQFFFAGASGTFAMQQANNNAGVGNTTRIKAGSYLLARKIF